MLSLSANFTRFPFPGISVSVTTFGDVFFRPSQSFCTPLLTSSLSRASWIVCLSGSGTIVLWTNPCETCLKSEGTRFSCHATRDRNPQVGMIGLKKKRAAEINNATALVPILEGAVFGNLRIEMYNSLFCFDLELSAR